MEEIKAPRKFKTEFVEKILGAGITTAEQVSRDDAKLFLSRIEEVIGKESWLELAVISFLGSKFGWTTDTVKEYLDNVGHDIRLMQLRLEETANG